MEEIFITNIIIDKVRHIEKTKIQLSSIEKKHLILTGKNGSGKTSILQSILSYLKVIEDRNLNNLSKWKQGIVDSNYRIDNLRNDLNYGNDANSLEKNRIEQQINDELYNLEHYDKYIRQYEQGTYLTFNNQNVINNGYEKGQFILGYYDSKRSSIMQTPSGINKLELNDSYRMLENPGTNFVQYLVNLRAQKSFARDEGHHEEVLKISRWFNKFEQGLRDIFEKDIKLEFDYQNYNFNVIEIGKEKYNLNNLSDGFSAILNVVTDLIMRMEKKHTKVYDMQGIVLIDEIETHLHVGLQKKILPFLTSFFPNIQFIVTTHSPFVLSSIENTIIYDLEKKLRVEDLSALSYSGIIEGYFNIDKYSKNVKDKLNIYVQLLDKQRDTHLSDAEKDRLKKLKSYLEDVPSYLSPELKSKFYELELIGIADMERA